MTLLQVISTPLHTRGRAEFSDGYWKLVLIWCVALYLVLVVLTSANYSSN